MPRKIDGLTVYCLSPRDFLESALEVHDWLLKFYPAAEQMTHDSSWDNYFTAVGNFKSAYDAVKKHPDWEKDGLRHTPFVSFNPVSDSTFFIFKLDNNGTTFIVGEPGGSINPGEEMD